MKYFTRPTKNLNIYPQSPKTIILGAASAFTLASKLLVSTFYIYISTGAKYSVHGNHFCWSLGTIREGKNFITFFSNNTFIVPQIEGSLNIQFCKVKLTLKAARQYYNITSHNPSVSGR